MYKIKNSPNSSYLPHSVSHGAHGDCYHSFIFIFRTQEPRDGSEISTSSAEVTSSSSKCSFPQPWENKLPIFFFSSSLQWKKVVTRHKSDLVLRKRSAGRVSKAVNPSYLSTCPSRARLGGSQGRSPSAEGTICRDIQHKQTRGKEGEKNRDPLPTPPEAASSPSHPSLALQLPFMPCQPPGRSGRCRAWSCSLLCQSWGDGRRLGQLVKKKKKKEHLHFATRTAAP